MAVPDTSLLAAGTAPPLPPLVSARSVRTRNLLRALALWIPAGILILLLAVCFLLPLVVKLPPGTGGSILDADDPLFSPGHWLGTDQVGNDIFTQLVYGGQVSFEVGISATVIGGAVGTAIGIVAGYFGGWVDAVLSRVLDILIAFPALILALVISQGLGSSEFHVILALSAFGVPALGRVTRGSTLVIRDLPYMTASRLAGTPRWRATLRHVLPNILPPLVTFSLLGVGLTILLEGALDYLGYGIPLTQPSWGHMIFTGVQVMSAEPRYVLVPSIVLLVTVTALNLMGNALRERWGVQ